MAKIVELDRRRQNGEHILKFENPVRAKDLALDIEQSATRGFEQKGRAYAELFAEMGVQPDVVHQLRQHLRQIHKASLDLWSEKEPPNNYCKRGTIMTPKFALS